MKKIIVFLFVALTATLVSAQSVAKRTKELNLEKGIALQGYDPVAYFTQKKAVKGKSSIAATFEGVTYYFASNDNKETFKKNPSSYEPQYGGWCAYAMGANGEKVEVDPQTFKIVNGKLFLFYNAYFNNTLKSWNKDEANLNRKADANWKKIFNAN
ncbi:YHS domain-containing (seleno)protein [Flavobacterium sedimenticola]|uniref:YHS domain-containing (Seleno)protein n=1 Tax=Flavobacterium sedimenticola TaxID=3043286 RepID=A0ABT6XSD0_9FLAO|nr:YHS domain-containing (seleno)protein [Flavobacterium sedimenticola]MDI9258011.1 YHS domain-containing (seleno)protein [Flavobacterium sedimenticola]